MNKIYFLDYLILVDCIDRLSQNVSKHLPTHTALLRRVKTWPVLQLRRLFFLVWAVMHWLMFLSSRRLKCVCVCLKHMLWY